MPDREPTDGRIPCDSCGGPSTYACGRGGWRHFGCDRCDARRAAKLAGEPTCAGCDALRARAEAAEAERDALRTRVVELEAERDHQRTRRIEWTREAQRLREALEAMLAGEPCECDACRRARELLAELR